MSDNFNNTMEFSSGSNAGGIVHDIIVEVYKALKEKGYDPINQIVGYIISGDPTYITSYKNARYLICHLERDEILEEMASFYLQKNI